MATRGGGIYIDGVANYGFYQNGLLNLNNNTNFTWGTYQSTGGPNDRPYLQVTGGNGSSGFSSDFVEIDTSYSYQAICYVKTFDRDSAGELAGGHLGFSCYDKDYNRIDLRNCGGVGNTTLSRDLAVEDDKAYITSNSGWYTGDTYYHKHIIFFPTASADYGVAYEYTRLGYGEYNIYFKSGGPTLTDQGDYEVDLEDRYDTSITMPDMGLGTLPAGTPVSNGKAGGTYSYAFSNPNYPETWTQKVTSVFTGESRNSSTPFRYATKYIKFMILKNYNQRTGPNDCVWGISNIFLGRVLDNKTYENII
jgi:hypothetical protein